MSGIIRRSTALTLAMIAAGAMLGVQNNHEMTTHWSAKVRMAIAAPVTQAASQPVQAGHVDDLDVQERRSRIAIEDAKFELELERRRHEFELQNQRLTHARRLRELEERQRQRDADADDARRRMDAEVARERQLAEPAITRETTVVVERERGSTGPAFIAPYHRNHHGREHRQHNYRPVHHR